MILHYDPETGRPRLVFTGSVFETVPEPNLAIETQPDDLFKAWRVVDGQLVRFEA